MATNLICITIVRKQTCTTAKITLAITRQITRQEDRHKFITRKNNCCQVLSRSRGEQTLFVNEYKVGRHYFRVLHGQIRKPEL